MKLNVGDKVLLDSAAGKYWTEIVDIVRAKNGNNEYCDWYIHCPIQPTTNWGSKLPSRSRFNEFMSDSLVKEVVSH